MQNLIKMNPRHELFLQRWQHIQIFNAVMSKKVLCNTQSTLLISMLLGKLLEIVHIKLSGSCAAHIDHPAPQALLS
jgi:hypothetical protein